MKYQHSNPVLRYALPLAVLGIGAVMLIPGEEAPIRAASVTEAPARSTPSFLAASPEMVAQLDASLAPATVDEDITLREASLPDPSAIPVSEPQVPAPVVETAATEPEANEPAPEAANPASALRVGNVAVNMRVGPSTGTGVIRALRPGETVALAEMEGNWANVTTEDGNTGWVYSSYLRGDALGTSASSEPRRETARAERRETPRAAAPAEDRRYARVASDVYLRAGPSQSTERLFVLPAGERVAIAETQGRWARVILPSGASGWVRIR